MKGTNTNVEKNMDIERIESAFEDSHLKINKRLNTLVGTWPFRPTSDRILRYIIVIAALLCGILPHFLGVSNECGRSDILCAENIAGLAYMSGTIVKFIIPVISKKKFEVLYNKIVENWMLITDPNEKSILDEYSKLGKLKTIFYVGYCLNAYICFTQIVMIPVILDIIIPLNQSREKVLITNAGYPFDPYEYYYELYLMYVVASLIATFIISSTDATHTVIIQQSLAVIALVKYRLEKISGERNDSYDLIISAIRMHQKGLEFLEFIESTYSIAFISFIGVTVTFLCCGSIIIVKSLDNPFELFRVSLFASGASIHIFFISWPGQLVIDGIENLHFATYTNEWYHQSEKSKTLLKIIMMRCSKINFLTAGGFYIINFENFGAIVKSTLSYVTVALSTI